MGLKQGDLALLDEPLAQELLHAPIPARLAYVWTDGTPRSVPIWFDWNGTEIILCGPPKAPKMKVFGEDIKVAVSIDFEAWPARALTIRGTARSEVVDGEAPEYAEITRKYLGEEGSLAWRQQIGQLLAQMVRITVVPEWAALLDVEGGRFPSALEAAQRDLEKRAAAAT